MEEICSYESLAKHYLPRADGKQVISVDSFSIAKTSNLFHFHT